MLNALLSWKLFTTQEKRWGSVFHCPFPVYSSAKTGALPLPCLFILFIPFWNSKPFLCSIKMLSCLYNKIGIILRGMLIYWKTLVDHAAMKFYAADDDDLNEKWAWWCLVGISHNTSVTLASHEMNLKRGVMIMIWMKREKEPSSVYHHQSVSAFSCEQLQVCSRFMGLPFIIHPLESQVYFCINRRSILEEKFVFQRK